MKKIILTFEGTLTHLAGNGYGQEIYENQVKGKIDYNNQTEIIFPDTIKDLAISFVQGFTADIFETIGIDKFFQCVTIKGNQKVIDKFKKAAYF